MAGCKPRLTYFPGRAIAEPIRLAFSAAGIEYEDVYLETREQFLQIIGDGKLIFKQVPLLEINGQCLVGSEVILRYVCRKGNLNGKTDEDQTRIDMLTMGAKDMAIPGIMSPILEAQFSTETAEQSDAKGIRDCKERYLPAFEKILGESTSGFLVGDSITVADIMLFDGLCYLHEDPKLKSQLENFPRCSAFIDHIASQPGIKEYLASPRRHPLPDIEFAKLCLRVRNVPIAGE